METAKEKAIREAWIAEITFEQYEKIKGHINPTDGYCVAYFNVMQEKPNIYKKLKLKGDVIAFRPKSLSGIENNNGWTRIESEADLPTEDIEYWCVERESNRIESVRMLNHNKSFNILYYSHYQPIIKPQPPIY